jgi:hypothetical protein
MVEPVSFAMLWAAAIASSDVLFRTQFLCSIKTRILLIDISKISGKREEKV